MIKIILLTLFPLILNAQYLEIEKRLQLWDDNSKIMRKIILNQARCKLCNDTITSYYNWDYQVCKCGAIAIDGGTVNPGWKKGIDNIEDLSVYDDADFETIRVSLYRGNIGKYGDQPLIYVPLCNMSNEWIENLLQYNIDRDVYDRWSVFGQAELIYREEKGIFIHPEQLEQDLNPEPKIIKWVSKQFNKQKDKWTRLFKK